MGEVVIVGAGVLAFLLLYFITHLEKEQYPLKILLLFFFFGSLLIMGQGVLNEQDYCDWLVSNSTVSGDTTSYVYSYDCETNNNESGNALYKLITWIIITVSALLFFYILFYKHFMKLTMKIMGKGGDDEE